MYKTKRKKMIEVSLENKIHFIEKRNLLILMDSIK